MKMKRNLQRKKSRIGEPNGEKPEVITADGDTTQSEAVPATPSMKYEITYPIK
jgi:hypothetical protein